MVSQEWLIGKKNSSKRYENNPLKDVVKPRIFRKIIKLGPDLEAIASSLPFSVRIDWKKVQFWRITLFLPMTLKRFQSFLLQRR